MFILYQLKNHDSITLVGLKILVLYRKWVPHRHQLGDRDIVTIKKHKRVTSKMEYRYFYFLPTYTFIDVKLVESGR